MTRKHIEIWLSRVIVFVFIAGCVRNNKNELTFNNSDFKNKLDSFIDKSPSKGDTLLIYLIDEELEDVNGDLYLDNDNILFIYSKPYSCEGYIGTIIYQDKNLFLYDLSQNLEFSSFINYSKLQNNCLNKQIKREVDLPYQMRYKLEKGKLELNP